jgi:hypothetical protein
VPPGLRGPAPLAVRRGVGVDLHFAQRMSAAELMIRVRGRVIGSPGVMDGGAGEPGKDARRPLPPPGVRESGEREGIVRPRGSRPHITQRTVTPWSSSPASDLRPVRDCSCALPRSSPEPGPVQEHFLIQAHRSPDTAQ